MPTKKICGVAVRSTLKQWAVDDKSNANLVHHALNSLAGNLLTDCALLDSKVLCDPDPLTDAEIDTISRDCWRAYHLIMELVDVTERE